MHTRPVPVRHHLIAVVLVLLAAAAVACGGDGAAAPEPSTSSSVDRSRATIPATDPPPSPTAAPTAAPTAPTAAPTAPTAAPTAPDTEPGVTDVEWQQQVSAICDTTLDMLVPVLDTPDPAARVSGFRRTSDAIRGLFDQLVAPSALEADLARILEIVEAGDSFLLDAEAALADGDLDAASLAADIYLNHLIQTDTSFMLTGAACTTDPGPIDNADLNVLVGLRNSQLDAGFGSIWVNQELGGSVVRIDPTTGERIATIEVGPLPLKMQPAGDRMWVRTQEAFVGIDPETNTVADVLLKSDVGPQANRSWATDGALWICDGNRVHRYDPATLQQVTVIELGHDCGQVYATPDLAIAWNYNEDPAQSGISAATVIEAGTDAVLAEIDLPVDVGVPIVLDDGIFFAGQLGSTAVVVSRDDWTVRSTHDLGRVTGISQNAYDGTYLYVGSYDDDPPEIFVIDPATFEIIDTIEPLNLNSLVVFDGSLWSTDADSDLLQRFDRPVAD